MRKWAFGLVLLLCGVFTSCSAGPQQLRRTVDDWDMKLYTQSPWLNAALHVIPVIPITEGLSYIGDFFVTNAYHFWVKDAWDGKGTGFKHAEYLGEDGYLESLLLDGSKFLEVKK